MFMYELFFNRRRKRDDTWVLNAGYGYDELTRALKNSERRVAAGHIGRGKGNLMDWISTNIISEYICNRTFLNIELYIYLIGSCNRVVRHKLATTISSSCLGYKAKFIHSWPWNSFNKCCQAIRDDPECSGKFFVYPVTGSCVCEKIGEECPRQFGFSTELHLM